MSLLEPTLAEPATPDDFARQAAERVTPLGEYLGAKLLGGLEATRPGEALGLARLPSRYAADEYGLPPPGPPPADLLTKEQFDGSIYKRPNLEWEEGETEARAAARAAVHDRQAYRDSLVARSDAGAFGQAAGFGLELGAAALDPTNYIPLIGPASKALMVARFGRIGGALLGHGAEAALNTGLFEPLAGLAAQTEGRGYGWEEAGSDILTNALGGALLGTAAGEAARALGFGHGAAPERTAPAPDRNPILPGAPEGFRAPEAGPASEPLTPITEPTAPPIVGVPEAGAGVVPRRAGQPPLRVDDLMRRADAAGLALDQLERGEPVDVGKLLANDPAVRRLYHGTTAPPFERFANTSDIGFHFASDPRTAEEFASGQEGGLSRTGGGAGSESGPGRVIEADVRIAEPLRMDDLGLWKPRDVARELERMGVAEPGFAERVRKEALVRAPDLKSDTVRAEQAKLIAEHLKSKGYDGIVYKNEKEGAAGRDSFIAIAPEQVGIVSQRAFTPGDHLATAAPEPPHPSVAEAAGRVGKDTPELETFAKDAKLEGYDKPLPGHEPKPEPVPGEPAKPEKVPTPAEKAAATAALPPELGEVEAMRREGSLTPADEATLAAGEAEATRAESYADAWTTLATCVLRNAV